MTKEENVLPFIALADNIDNNTLDPLALCILLLRKPIRNLCVEVQSVRGRGRGRHAPGYFRIAIRRAI